MPNLALLALEASDGTVVLTSITLVFAMLVALCLIITLEGKIFDNINNKKNGKPAAPKAPAAKAAPAPAAKPAAPAAKADNGLHSRRDHRRDLRCRGHGLRRQCRHSRHQARFQACRRFPPRCLGRRRCA